MKKTRKSTAIVCFILAGVLALGLYAGATAADDQETELLGTLSARYEAKSPGTISSGNGDPGGKSYGSYQLASKYDGPKSFFEWCQASEDTYYKSIGDRLSTAYYTGSPGYGSIFDAEWKALAKENAAGFEQCQRNYIRKKYYEPIVKRVEKNHPGFFISNYSIALRNVLWSRAVQFGTGGAEEMMDDVFAALGGFHNQSEAELIRAIYADSSAVRDPRTDRTEYTMSGDTAERYGIAGKTMAWFWSSSSSVQVGVYTRLAINEPAQAQQMLATYGYVDAPLDEGEYTFSPADNAALALVAGSGSATLNATADTPAQHFRLTYFASGYYTVTSVATGERLTALADGTVTMAAPTADNNQMWKLENLNSGFALRNRATETYLTAAVSAGAGVAAGSEAMQWQLGKAGAAWTLTGAAYPTYAQTLTVGNSTYPLRGTLRCVYPIRSVKVRVLNAAGKDAMTPASATGLSAKVYDLSNLDSKVAFSRLSAGSYQLVIEAAADGCGNFRLTSDFYVSDGTYLLTFDAQGGTAAETSRRVSAGQAYGELPTATKDGHLFVGWFTAAEGGTQVSATSTAPAANSTLYARYEKAYAYAFRNYDGSNVAAGLLADGAVIPLPAENPTRPPEGEFYFTFAAWDGYSQGMTISGDIVFTARYDQHLLGPLAEMATEAYTIRDGYLRGIAAGTTVAAVHQQLIPNDFITIGNGGTAAIGPAATGMQVDYTVDGHTIQSLQIVVTGDLNGDGKITGTDLIRLRSHLLGKQLLTDAALQAADLNGDGKVTGTDLVQLISHLLGRTVIKPN